MASLHKLTPLTSRGGGNSGGGGNGDAGGLESEFTGNIFLCFI